LNLLAVGARKAGNAKRASTYEMQSVQAEDAMQQVAAGTLMFLMLPQGALDPGQSGQIAQQSQAQQSQSPQQPPSPDDGSQAQPQQ
jgi:hypothetical protein